MSTYPDSFITKDGLAVEAKRITPGTDDYKDVLDWLHREGIDANYEHSSVIINLYHPEEDSFVSLWSGKLPGGVVQFYPTNGEVERVVVPSGYWVIIPGVSDGALFSIALDEWVKTDLIPI